MTVVTNPEGRGTFPAVAVFQESSDLCYLAR